MRAYAYAGEVQWVAARVYRGQTGAGARPAAAERQRMQELLFSINQEPNALVP